MEKRDFPYIWVTWISKLLAGENSCEWAIWFKAHLLGYGKVPSNFNSVEWQLAHTRQLDALHQSLEAEGATITRENQNSFRLDGQTAKLAGKPDLVVVRGAKGKVYDVKTGNPRASDVVQVMLYLYALPLALPRRFGKLEIAGAVVYEDHLVEVGKDQIDDAFKGQVKSLVQRVASDDPAPARKVPSGRECAFCDITEEDCPERAPDNEVWGSTTDF